MPLRRRPRFGLMADEVIARVGGCVLDNIVTSVLAVRLQLALEGSRLVLWWRGGRWLCDLRLTFG